MQDSLESGDDRLIRILEKQKQELVIRFLRKHEEAQASRTFIDRIMSNLSDLILVLAADLRIVQASAEFYHVLDYPSPPGSLPSSTLAADSSQVPAPAPASASDFVPAFTPATRSDSPEGDDDPPGLLLSDVCSEENCAQISERLKSAEFHGLECSLISRSGKSVPVVLRGTSYVTEGGRTLHMLIASDRREFYDVMSRMREVQDQLIHSGRLASLGEMAAGIGHELTQPLNTVLLLARNSLKAMADPVGNTEMIRDNLTTIVDRVNHASSIIRSLKGFAGKARGELVPVRVNAVLRDVLKFLDGQLLLSEIEVKLRMVHRDFWVLAQEVRVEQVLLNLIQNAIQAMAASEKPLLEIDIFLREGVDPQSLQQRWFVNISVADNGEGIPPAIRDKIFDPFFTTREVGSGMGLGLSIVERIVRGFGGNIKVNSRPGEGTTFIVQLPCYGDPSFRESDGGPV